MVRIILFVVFGFHFSAMAQLNSPLLPANYQLVKCPAVPEEYERMIAQLDSMKASIKENANCKPITDSVKTLEELLNTDRKKVIELVDRGDEVPLTAEESELIAKYSENITKKVSSLADLFMGSKQCFEGDQVDNQLASLAGFVGEASALAGSVAGPWGTPIAIAGNVIAGFMKGLDQIIKSHNQGYDFTKRAQWMNYVQNLCTYHTYKDQIDHLLNPGTRIEQLKVFRAKLDSQIAILTEKCPECASIKSTYLANRGASQAKLQVLMKRDLDNADSRYTEAVASFTLENLGLRDWAEKEIKRLMDEANQHTNTVSGRNVLYSAKREIEEFLISHEAQRFLYNQIRESHEQYQEFLWHSENDGSLVYYDLQKAGAQAIARPLPNRWGDGTEYFRSLVTNAIYWDRIPQTPANEDLMYSWRAYVLQSVDKLRTSESSVEVVQSFCTFFKLSGVYDGDIRSVCNSPDFIELVGIQGGLDKEIVASATIGGLAPSPLLVNDPNVVFSANRYDALMKGVELRETKLQSGLQLR